MVLPVMIDMIRILLDARQPKSFSQATRRRFASSSPGLSTAATAFPESPCCPFRPAASRLPVSLTPGTLARFLGLPGRQRATVQPCIITHDCNRSMVFEDWRSCQFLWRVTVALDERSESPAPFGVPLPDLSTAGCVPEAFWVKARISAVTAPDACWCWWNACDICANAGCASPPSRHNASSLAMRRLDRRPLRAPPNPRPDTVCQLHVVGPDHRSMVEQLRLQLSLCL